MTAQPAMLTEAHRVVVDHLVAKGDFPSAETVVAHAIELLQDD